MALASVAFVVGAVGLAGPAGAATGGTVRAFVETTAGDALSGICLDLLVPGPVNSAPNVVVETAPSDLTGLITQANVPAGTYAGYFRDCGNLDPNYVSRFYGGSGFNEAKATPITITDGATTRLGHQRIDLGATINGTLTDPVTLGPASNVTVTAWTATGHLLAEEYANPWCTDGSGFYSIAALPTTGVKLEFAQAPFFECGGDLPYTDQYYNGATKYGAATVISPSPDSTVTADATLTRAFATTPTISSITFAGSVDSPTITLHGSHFGSQPAGSPTVCQTPTGDDGRVFPRGVLYLVDNTGGWAAGFGGDCIGLIITSYSATRIVYTLGAWYQQVGQPDDGFNLSAGDDVSLTVKGTTASTTVSYPA